MPSVELIESKLAPFKNAAHGKMGQEVLTTWKNTGDTPIRMVAAEIKPVNADGSPRQSFHYTLYAEFDDSPAYPSGPASLLPDTPWRSLVPWADHGVALRRCWAGMLSRPGGPCYRAMLLPC
ncbi:hypothetical protein [Aureliella helgolandensis]|uniref:Uncharacterized protein n=1 Tax=Aureliella helgolandensis TaxID=2527968 RepID=A0A518G2Z3_9BACT|nr:hypothetical protein [Aureliella helgolandensis]QDV22909.1 hypothetical protein Q31a_12020 [Aureliella helgolandensis]